MSVVLTAPALASQTSRADSHLGTDFYGFCQIHALFTHRALAWPPHSNDQLGMSSGMPLSTLA
jgi:hypothetical protein